jgi:glucose-6-phosphate isomerase
LFTDSDVEVSAQNLDLDSNSSLTDAFGELLAAIEDSSYLAIHAYLDRGRDQAFETLRELFARVTGRPTTFGWGPRFLHSTGQYHKGGPRQGVFLQLIGTGDKDIQVPGRNFGFSELMNSQADGDADVLAAAGRPVLTLRLSDNKVALALVTQILETKNSRI